MHQAVACAPVSTCIGVSHNHSQKYLARVAVCFGLPYQCCDTYAHYASVADCADAMADAWEDTAGCALADCLHGNILKC